MSSFVVNEAVYQCQVMPYGLRKASATLVESVKNCAVYIDDVVMFDTCWKEHLDNVEALVRRLEEAGLIVNLAKCEFIQVSVQYLGYVVGHGQVSPTQAKMEAIKNFKAPHCRCVIQRFGGMTGYYRCFIRGYSAVLGPLTDLLRKDTE